MQNRRFVALIILDGWGLNTRKDHNAVALAETPTMDRIWSTCPRTTLLTSGHSVGLPDGLMGNSEVGHLNLGAGRVVLQAMTQIEDRVNDGSLLRNEALIAAMDRLPGTVRRLHLRGDRGGDVSIFPDLKREADVIAVLHGQGLPVPEIYGYLADPPCIVMEAIEGTRDFSALDAATKSVIGRVYMQAVAAMHRLPVEPFMAAGVHRPEGAEAIALVGLDGVHLELFREVPWGTGMETETLADRARGWHLPCETLAPVPTLLTPASLESAA